MSRRQIYDDKLRALVREEVAKCLGQNQNNLTPRGPSGTAQGGGFESIDEKTMADAQREYDLSRRKKKPSNSSARSTR